MRRTTAAVAAALVAAAGVAAWLLARAGGGAGSAAGGLGDEAPAAESDAAQMARADVGRVGDVPEAAPPAPAPRDVVGIVVGPPGFSPRSAVIEADAEPGWTVGRAGRPLSPAPSRVFAVPDAAGRFRLERVRRNGDVKVAVESRDARALGAVALARAGGPPLRVVLRAAPAPATVTVLDADGKPVAGANVWVSGSPSASRAGDDDAPSRAARRHLDGGWTGKDGRLRFVPPPADYEAEAWVRAPQARADLPERWSATCAAGGEVTVRLPRAGAVAGVVRDQRGKPAPEAWLAWRQGDGPWAEERVQPDGTFSLTRLPSGPIALAALPRAPEPDEDALLEETWRGVRVPEGTPTTTVATGATGVVLAVDMGETLDVRIEGWPRTTGQFALLTREDGGPPRTTVETDVSADGRAAFRTLAGNATYTLWVSLLHDGPIAYRTGLRPADGAVVVPLVQGKTLRVRLAWPGNVRWYVEGVSIDDRGVSLWAEDDSLGSDAPTSWTFHGLPDGAWTVRVTGHCDDPRGEDLPTMRAEGTGRGTAGGEVVIEMKPVAAKEEVR